MRKTSEKNSTLLRSVACALIAFFVCACTQSNRAVESLTEASSGALPPASSPRLQATGSSAADLLRVNTILIAPTQFEKDIGTVAGEQERFDRALELAAEQELTVEFTPPAKARPLFPVTAGSDDEFAKRAIDVARKANREGVLVVRVSTVAERDGSSLGADSPAALGFAATLYRVANEKAAWSVHYFVQDQAILENLLNARNQLTPGASPGWKSLEDHLTAGFSEALQDLSSRRQNAFSNPAS